VTSSQSGVTTGTNTAVTIGQFGETVIAEVRRPLRPTSTTLLLRIFKSSEDGGTPADLMSPSAEPQPSSVGTAPKWTDSSPLIGMLADLVISCGGTLSGEDDGVLVATVPGALQAVLTATRIQCLVAGFSRFPGSQIIGVGIGISASGAPATRKKGADPSGRTAFRNQALPGKVLVLGMIRRQLEGLPGISLRKIDEGASSRASLSGAGIGQITETSEVVIPDLGAMAETLIQVPAGAVAPLPAFEGKPGSSAAANAAGQGAKTGDTGLRSSRDNLSGVANAFGESSGNAWSAVVEGGNGFSAKTKEAVLGVLEQLPDPIQKRAKWIAIGVALVIGVGLALLLRPVLFPVKPAQTVARVTETKQVAPSKPTIPVTGTVAGQARADQGTTGLSSVGSPPPAKPEPAKPVDAKHTAAESKSKAEPNKPPQGNGKGSQPGGDQGTPKAEPQAGDSVKPEPVKTHGGLIVSLSPDLIEDLLKRADDSNNRGDYDQAIRYCNRVLAGDPRNSKALSIRAQAQERKGTSR